MGLDKIWVFGEVAGDEVASITLEMLAAARSLADTVEVFMAGDGGEYAEQLGEHGAETVYSTGDLAGGLQGVAIASAVAAAINSAICASEYGLLPSSFPRSPLSLLGKFRGRSSPHLPWPRSVRNSVSYASLASCNEPYLPTCFFFRLPSSVSR